MKKKSRKAAPLEPRQAPASPPPTARREDPETRSYPPFDRMGLPCLPGCDPQDDTAARPPDVDPPVKPKEVDSPNNAVVRRLPFKIPAGFRDAETEARKALTEANPDAGADELILQDLAARQMPIVRMLLHLEAQLAIRMVDLDDIPMLLAVARVLKDTTALSAAVSRRVQNVLSSTASLRAQRRLLAGSARSIEARDDV